MPGYDGSIVIDSHIDTSNFDKDASKMFSKSKEISNKLSNTFKFNNSSFSRELVNASDPLRRLSNELTKAKNSSIKLRASFSGMHASISNAFSGIGNMFTNTFSGIGKIFSTIVRRTQWILLGQTIRAVIADAKESVQDLRTYNQDFDKSMQSIRDSFKNAGNAIATSFAPILQALTPIIVNLIRWITELFNKITLFTTALFTNSKTAVIADTNFSGYSKSANKAAASTKKGTKAIKEQTNALAKFDKLDVFKQDKSKSPSDSGIQPEDIPQAMNMFKTVDIPNNILELKNKLSEIFDEISRKFKILADEFNKGFKLGFKEKNLDVIQDKLQKIGKHLNEIFGDKNVVNKFNETILTLSFNLGRVVGAMSSVGVSLAKMLIGGFEKFLDGNKERIKKSIIRNLDTTIDFSNLIGDFSEFIAYLATVFGGDHAQAIFGNFLSITYNLFDTTFSNIYKVVEKAAEALAYPFINNQEKIKEALEGIFAAVDSATHGADAAFKGLGDAITDVVDNSIVPALNTIKQVWQDEFGVIIAAWNKSLKPTFEEIGEKLGDVGEKIGETFKKVAKPINSIFGLIVKEYNKIRPFIETYVLPFAEKVLTFIGTNIGNVFETAFNFIDLILNNALDAIGNFAEQIAKFVDTISDIMNGDWNKAWEDGKEAVKSLARAVLSILKVIPDMFVEGINAILRVINSVTGLINGIGIGDFRINIPKIPQISRPPMYFGIPGLAAGTVVSPNRRFLAMLGDNTSEAEVVSPVSTMKQAFMEAMYETGMNTNNGNVVLQLDGTTFARLINPYTKSEQNRIGISMVEGVAY